MRKFIYIVIVSVLIVSCGGGGDDPQPTPTPEPENRAPSKPTLNDPVNNLLCIDNAVSFKWNAASDPDGDTVSYMLEIAEDNAFSPIAHSLAITTNTKAVSLEKGVAYYWRVKAKDSKNALSAYSSTYQFYTEGVGIVNHLPFTPSLVKPTLNAVEQNATTILEWSASDVDTNDTLSYDVYFGTDNPPTEKVSENQSEKTKEINLDSSKDYFWKVVVKDGKGGETFGPVWSFKTD